MFVATFQRDETGAVFVEVAVLFPIIITVLFGSVDLLYAFYQWNAAAKAVEVGARIAAVSDPVASGLNRLSDQAVLNGTRALAVQCRRLLSPAMAVRRPAPAPAPASEWRRIHIIGQP